MTTNTSSALLAWQPNETAPKDGTRILLFDVIHEAVFIAHYRADQNKPGPYGHYVWKMDEEAGAIAELAITHWMPLPSPPASGEPQRVKPLTAESLLASGEDVVVLSDGTCVAASGEPQPVDPLADLVKRFSAALLDKLYETQRKGKSGWDAPTWKQECQQALIDHLAKGDPLDVAAYCAFMWHHGWSTKRPHPSPTEAKLREAQLRIQAVGAAISRKDWHAVERAYEAIRDEFDGRAALSAQEGKAQ